MKSNIVMVILINLLLLALGVLLIEWQFGSWTNPSNLNRLNLTIDKTVTYNVSKLYPADDPIVTVKRDTNGLRGDFDSPTEVTILTVGGSTTDQRYITDGDTWQDVMQQAFAAEGKNIVVANAGVDGQSTYGHLKNFDWWFNQVDGLHPRYIIFYIGINDFRTEAGHKSNVLKTAKKNKSLEQRIRDDSALFYLYRTLRGMYLVEKKKLGHRARDFDRKPWVSQPLQQDYDTMMASRLTAYRQRLEQLIAKTRAMGAEAIFATNPVYIYRTVDGQLQGSSSAGEYEGIPINGVDYYHMDRLLHDTTLNVCAQYATPCVDLAALPIWRADDFYDSVHMTPAGAYKVGTELHTALSELL